MLISQKKIQYGKMMMITVIRMYTITQLYVHTCLPVLYRYNYIYLFFCNSMDIALNAQNHKLACARPEKLYVDYLANKYKALTGTPSWAKLDKVEVDDTDSHILKVCHFNL